jgi:hypothetical protein
MVAARGEGNGRLPLVRLVKRCHGRCAVAPAAVAIDAVVAPGPGTGVAVVVDAVQQAAEIGAGVAGVGRNSPTMVGLSRLASLTLLNSGE